MKKKKHIDYFKIFAVILNLVYISVFALALAYIIDQISFYPDQSLEERAFYVFLLFYFLLKPDLFLVYDLLIGDKK